MISILLPIKVLLIYCDVLQIALLFLVVTFVLMLALIVFSIIDLLLIIFGSFIFTLTIKKIWLKNEIWNLHLIILVINLFMSYVACNFNSLRFIMIIVMLSLSLLKKGAWWSLSHGIQYFVVHLRLQWHVSVITIYLQIIFLWS